MRLTYSVPPCPIGEPSAVDNWQKAPSHTFTAIKENHTNQDMRGRIMERKTSRQVKVRLIAAAAAVCFGAAGVAVPLVTAVAAAPVAHASVVSADNASPDCCTGG